MSTFLHCLRIDWQNNARWWTLKYVGSSEQSRFDRRRQEEMSSMQVHSVIVVMVTFSAHIMHAEEIIAQAERETAWLLLPELQSLKCTTAECVKPMELVRKRVNGERLFTSWINRNTVSTHCDRLCASFMYMLTAAFEVKLSKSTQQPARCRQETHTRCRLYSRALAARFYTARTCKTIFVFTPSLTGYCAKFGSSTSNTVSWSIDIISRHLLTTAVLW